MNRTKFVCYFIAASQFLLGGLYLFFPGDFITLQGLTPISADIGYPLALLAARCIIYGFGMVAIGNNPEKYRLWLDGMIGIQLIDLFAGLYYLSIGVVTFATAGGLILTALLFLILMFWIRQRSSGALG